MTTTSPRTDSLIAKVMAEYPTDHLASRGVKGALAKYYEAVHQELAPFCRSLEAENLALRDAMCNPVLKAGIEKNSRASAVAPTRSKIMPKATRFIGTKTILAQAMTRGEYNEYRGWAPPDKEDQAVAGYLVEYTDGGGANDVRHTGYISWSPKEQFDNAYRERPLVPGLAPHEQRVFDERSDLIERMTKLAAFFDMPLFASLDEAEQSRLRQQHHAMTCYAAILSERIDAFA